MYENMQIVSFQQMGLYILYSKNMQVSMHFNCEYPFLLHKCPTEGQVETRKGEIEWE
jgi:hypothetical protein